MKLKDINIHNRMEHYHLTGLNYAVIENDYVSIAETFGVLKKENMKKVNTNTIFNACFISKFVTSMLVMKLVEQGILDLDEDVNKKVTSWEIPNNDLTRIHKVTLRRLLCHQSGIIDPENSLDGV